MRLPYQWKRETRDSANHLWGETHKNISETPHLGGSPPTRGPSNPPPGGVFFTHPAPRVGWRRLFFLAGDTEGEGGVGCWRGRGGSAGALEVFNTEPYIQ